MFKWQQYEEFPQDYFTQLDEFPFVKADIYEPMTKRSLYSWQVWITPALVPTRLETAKTLAQAFIDASTCLEEIYSQFKEAKDKADGNEA